MLGDITGLVTSVGNTLETVANVSLILITSFSQ